MEEQKETKVSGDVKVKKSFARSLIAGDLTDIRDALVDNVAVPSLKKLFYDIVCNGADVLFYGRSATHANSSQVGLKTPYSRISTSRSGGTTFTSVPSNSVESTSGPISINRDYERLIFTSRADANEVLADLIEVIDQNNYAKLSDLYYILNKMFPKLGIKSNYTDEYYGWYSLGDAEIKDDPEGCWLRLPKVTALK